MLLRSHCHGLTTAARARPCAGLPIATPLATPNALRRRSYATDGEPQQPHIGVLGGGISGLASAYYVLKNDPSARITIYESSDRLGGWLQSSRVPVRDGTVLFEGALRTIRPVGNGKGTIKLLEELDIADKAIFTSKNAPAAQSRYLFYPDHLVRMPHPAFGIGDILWKLWSEPAFKSLPGAILGEPFRNLRDDNIRDESIAAFLSRRFNKNIVDRLVSGVIHGIYAGDVHQLSAKSLLPVFWRDEGAEGAILTGSLRSFAEGQPMTKLDDEFFEHMRKNGPAPRLRHLADRSSVYTFPNGSQTLADALAGRLIESGRVTFKVNSPVQAIAPTSGSSIDILCDNRTVRHSQLISSLPPGKLEKICCAPNGTERPAPTTVIPHMPTVTVMTVNLYYRTPGLHPPGFGYLIPQATPFDQNPERALGVVFDDAVAPDPANMADDSFRQLDPSWNQADPRVSPEDLRIRSPLENSPQDEVTARGTKLTVMLGGHWWDDWTSYPDEQEGLALARSLLERHLGIKEEPEAWKVNLQRDCIPQYVVGHEDKLKTARANLERHYGGRLRVTGNWVSGVGVNDCIRSAWHVARSLQDWRGTGLEHIGEPYIYRVKQVLRKPSRAP